MLTSLVIRQKMYYEYWEEDGYDFSVRDNSGIELTGKETIGEAIAFAQGILGDAHDESFPDEEVQRIVLELDSLSIAFDSNDVTLEAYEEGRNHPKSNKALLDS